MNRMTDQEFFARSLEVSTEFDRYVMSHPEIAERIPPHALVVFLLEQGPEFSEKSLELAHATHQPNQPVLLVKVERLITPTETRLVNPRLEVASNF